MNCDRPIVLNRKSSSEERQVALQHIYAQVLERQPYAFERKQLQSQEKDFLSGKLGVRHFLRELGCSRIYLDSFYANCSNLKFLELCFKHFLGRALIDETEVEHHVRILMKHGVSAIIAEIIGSEEYSKAFGCFTIPYARTLKFYPSTQNFLQSQIINREHVGQRGRYVPTLYWKQLGLNCESGTCIHPEVDGAYKMEESQQQNIHQMTLDDEIEELLQMLQKGGDAKTTLRQMSAQKRETLAALVKQKVKSD